MVLDPLKSWSPFFKKTQVRPHGFWIRVWQKNKPYEEITFWLQELSDPWQKFCLGSDKVF